MTHLWSLRLCLANFVIAGSSVEVPEVGIEPRHSEKCGRLNPGLDTCFLGSELSVLMAPRFPAHMQLFILAV